MNLWQILIGLWFIFCIVAAILYDGKDLRVRAWFTMLVAFGEAVVLHLGGFW